MNPGDIIAFSGANFVSDFLNVVTYGIPRFSISHVAIVADYGVAEMRSQLIFESTTINSSPCEIRGIATRGAQAQFLNTRLLSYEGVIWHYPLIKSLSEAESETLTGYLVPMLGTPYGEVAAFRSGGLGFSWLEQKIHGPANLSSIFCSEWVAGAHKAVGILATDNIGKWNPNRLIRHERHYGILGSPTRLK
jgi:hypothetical protein